MSIDESSEEVKFTLYAVIIDIDRKLCIINDRILKVGSVINGAMIQKIEKGRVDLMVGGERFSLTTNQKIKTIKLLAGEKNEI